MRFAALLFCLAIGACGALTPSQTEPEPEGSDNVRLRVATYNIEDVRTPELLDAQNARLRAAAAAIQSVAPDIILINEMAYNAAGEGRSGRELAGSNGQRFADTFLSVSQGAGLSPIRYTAFSAPTNTGLASGLDLDNDGRAVTRVPPGAGERGTAAQSSEERAYGNDAWGFGTFPGQYGMTLLVREGLTILRDSVRTFQLFPWSRMPGALRPVDPRTGEPWHTDEEWRQLRLSSKSHWDVPVRLPNGSVLHLLASHPTPPAFDGPERRNELRNHDEIRFWADYLNGADDIRDDAGRSGGLPPGAPFVILGDQNADPDEGSAHDNPIGLLLDHPRVNAAFVPVAPEHAAGAEELDPDDTAEWWLRVDYVLPSKGLRVVNGAVRRPTEEEQAASVSDHFMVWLDIVVPPSSRRPE